MVDHLLVAPEKAPVFLPVVTLNDWRQAIQLRRCGRIFLDVTLVRAPVIGVFEILNKYIKLFNIR